MNIITNIKDRNFPEGSYKPDIYSKSNTLILIKQNGKRFFAINSGSKASLIQSCETGDEILLVWGGQWSSDVYSISKIDIKSFTK